MVNESPALVTFAEERPLFKECLRAEKEKKSRDSIAIELRVAENKKASAFADFDEF